MEYFKELRNEAFEEMIESRKAQWDCANQKSKMLKREVASLEAEIMFLVVCGKKESEECQNMIAQRNSKYADYQREVEKNEPLAKQINEEIFKLETLMDIDYNPEKF